MGRDLTLALIDATAAAIAAHVDELTRLDQAIGDGDHGSNLDRGFRAIAAQRDGLAELPPAAALQKAGMILVSTVGGASGPLYGSLLLGTGRALAAGAEPAAALAEGVEAVKRRGKSEVGAKTMLDVLVPVVAAWRGGAPPFEELRLVAATSRDATVPMQARRGRASFLGERSIGHCDPGAASVAVLVAAVCDALERRA